MSWSTTYGKLLRKYTVFEVTPVVHELSRKHMDWEAIPLKQRVQMVEEELERRKNEFGGAKE